MWGWLMQDCNQRVSQLHHQHSKNVVVLLQNSARIALDFFGLLFLTWLVFPIGAL
jgi:hypothetical protein